MFDLAEILAAILFLSMGSGYLHLRILIAGYLALSALFGFVLSWYGVIDYVGGDVYYVNLVLSTGFCVLSALRPNKYTLCSGAAFLITSILCLLSYVGYHAGITMFYDVYPAAMLALTVWQLALLIRIGNVGGNLESKLGRFASYRLRGDRYFHHSANTLWARGYAGECRG